MESVRTKVAEGGRIVIPAEFRRALDIKVGDDVVLELEDDQVRILTLREIVRRSQELVLRYIPRDRSLVDELIAERRAEAERE